MKRSDEDHHSVRYAEYSKLKGETKLDYFKKMEESRPLDADLLLMTDEMIVFSISRDIVKVIIHQLVLDYDPNKSADRNTITTANVEDIFTLIVGNNETKITMKNNGPLNCILHVVLCVSAGFCTYQLVFHFVNAPSCCSI